MRRLFVEAEQSLSRRGICLVLGLCDDDIGHWGRVSDDSESSKGNQNCLPRCFVSQKDSFASRVGSPNGRVEKIMNVWSRGC
jgi:hypothetical protein